MAIDNKLKQKLSRYLHNYNTNYLYLTKINCIRLYLK